MLRQKVVQVSLFQFNANGFELRTSAPMKFPRLIQTFTNFQLKTSLVISGWKPLLLMKISTMGRLTVNLDRLNLTLQLVRPLSICWELAALNFQYQCFSQ